VKSEKKVEHFVSTRQHRVVRVSLGRIMVGLFGTKFVVPRQIKPRNLELSYDEKDYYRVV